MDALRGLSIEDFKSDLDLPEIDLSITTQPIQAEPAEPAEQTTQARPERTYTTPEGTFSHKDLIAETYKAFAQDVASQQGISLKDFMFEMRAGLRTVAANHGIYNTFSITHDEVLDVITSNLNPGETLISYNRTSLKEIQDQIKDVDAQLETLEHLDPLDLTPEQEKQLNDLSLLHDKLSAQLKSVPAKTYTNRNAYIFSRFKQQLHVDKYDRMNFYNQFDEEYVTGHTEKMDENLYLRILNINKFVRRDGAAILSVSSTPFPNIQLYSEEEVKKGVKHINCLAFALNKCFDEVFSYPFRDEFMVKREDIQDIVNDSRITIYLTVVTNHKRAPFTNFARVSRIDANGKPQYLKADKFLYRPNEKVLSGKAAREEAEKIDHVYNITLWHIDHWLDGELQKDFDKGKFTMNQFLTMVEDPDNDPRMSPMWSKYINTLQHYTASKHDDEIPAVWFARPMTNAEVSEIYYSDREIRTFAMEHLVNYRREQRPYVYRYSKRFDNTPTIVFSLDSETNTMMKEQQIFRRILSKNLARVPKTGDDVDRLKRGAVSKSLAEFCHEVVFPNLSEEDSLIKQLELFPTVGALFSKYFHLYPYAAALLHKTTSDKRISANEDRVRYYDFVLDWAFPSKEKTVSEKLCALIEYYCNVVYPNHRKVIYIHNLSFDAPILLGNLYAKYACTSLRLDSDPLRFQFRDLKLEIIDSYKIHSTALASFPKIYNIKRVGTIDGQELDAVKSIYPYSWYSSANYKRTKVLFSKVKSCFSKADLKAFRDQCTTVLTEDEQYIVGQLSMMGTDSRGKRLPFYFNPNATLKYYLFYDVYILYQAVNKMNDMFQTIYDEVLKQFPEARTRIKSLFTDADVKKLAAQYYKGEAAQEGAVKEFRDEILDKHISKFNLHNFITASSIGEFFMNVMGAFDDTYEITGYLQEFIAQGANGGQCGTANGAKHMIVAEENEKICDLDANSLYPWAMSVISFPTGMAFAFDNRKTTSVEVKEKPVWHAYCSIKHEKKDQFLKTLTNNFGALPIRDEEGVIQWCFDIDSKGNPCTFGTGVITKGKDYRCVVSSEYAKVLEETYGYTVKPLYGFYWNTSNSNCQKAIKFLFDLRVEYIKTKNPVQLLIKLLMNSSYGKTLLKKRPFKEYSISTSTKYPDIDEYCAEYIARNKNCCPETQQFGRNAIIKKISHEAHWNRVHIGSTILGKAKEYIARLSQAIINCDGKLMQCDTDSVVFAIDRDNFTKIGQTYEAMYDFKIIQPGKALGCADSDFKGDTEGRMAISLAKKCYCVLLNNGVCHARLKGVPKSCIVDACVNLKTDVLGLYREMYQGHKIHFNMACPIYSCDPDETPIKVVGDDVMIGDVPYSELGGEIRPSFDCNLTSVTIRAPMIRSLSFTSEGIMDAVEEPLEI